MGTEGTLGLRERIVAAAGASVVAALIVNPLDVVKSAGQLLTLVCDRSCLRHLPPQCECSMTAIRQYCLWQGALPHTSLAVSTLGVAGQLMAVRAPLLNRSWAISSCPICDAPGQVARGGCGSTGPEAYKGMWDAAQKIVQKEGVGVLWRGSRTSLLLAVPMVGIYMPIYDYLTDGLRPMGLAAPVVAGAVSRATAVFACAPLELLRTRIYANVPTSIPGAGVGPSTSAAAAAAAALPLQPAAALPLQISRLLMSLPRMWTGLTATLARDVPFSMLYWGMLEPIRAELLRQMPPSLPPTLTTTSPSTPLSLTGAAHSPITSHDRTAVPGANPVSTHHSSAVPSHDAEAASAAYLPPGSGPSTAIASSPAEQMVGMHSHVQLLTANLIAGSSAGGLAAAITTPFDVVKTRQQVAAGRPERVLQLMQRIYRQEGLAGLYRGVVPRVARAAPACAIVISVYELLKKSLLVPELLLD